MIIAVASGKGGTGKTTVATSLALALATDEALPRRDVLFLDCDVEEPNAAFFLKPALGEGVEVGIPIPEVDFAKCTYCGRCGEVCAWHAIAVVGQKVLIFRELCHGCGSCTLNCPEEAMHEVLHVMGTLQSGRAGPIEFGQGTLNVGEAMPVPLIRQLKKRRLAHGETDRDKRAGNAQDGSVAILDAPPGTSCPVVEIMRGADFVLLVTEPTPFGLHDLKLALQVARDELGLPAGVVINRDGCGDKGVEEYCAAEGIPILMRIPLDRRIAEAIAEGKALVEAFPHYRSQFIQLYQRILEEAAR